jgi:hypothetical protein
MNIKKYQLIDVWIWACIYIYTFFVHSIIYKLCIFYIYAIYIYIYIYISWNDKPVTMRQNGSQKGMGIKLTNWELPQQT